jgi:hypothetical protein
MAFLLALLIPVGLMLLMVGMGRVERSLNTGFVGDRVAAAMSAADVEAVESLVSTGAATALERYWRRRGLLSRVRIPNAGRADSRM